MEDGPLCCEDIALAQATIYEHGVSRHRGELMGTVPTVTKMLPSTMDSNGKTTKERPSRPKKLPLSKLANRFVSMAYCYFAGLFDPPLVKILGLHSESD